ncbi:MAG TPA: amidohydrolase family protein [Telluria sp.]|nr:amidohydrolase family protein [Telluria sp.]
MTRHLFALVAGLLAAGSALAQVPVADHHQHGFSPAIIDLIKPGPTGPHQLLAADLIKHLDDAGIKRATLLSTAYMFGKPGRAVENEYAKVRAENDWTGAQAAQYPDRLRAFCGIAPFAQYALEEIERCARSPHLKHGIKLHLGNSDVQLEDPAHAERLRQVFATANKNGMAIVVHMRASISKKRPYGLEQARAFIEKVMPGAPDVPVQLAHMAGTGPGYDDPPSQAVTSTIAEAVAKGDPRTKNLWFDVASVANGATPEQAALLARHIRQVGVNRVLYGSDAAAGGNLAPREAWAAFRKIPLTDAEFATIASNVAPYLR